MLIAFLQPAINLTLYQAVMNGNAVEYSGFKSAVAVADTLTRDLQNILSGSGLGKFEGKPVCALWFAPVTPAPGPKSTPVATSGDGRDAKRPKLDQAELDRKKTLGMLVFDTAAAGTKRLPTPTARGKKKGSKTPERICMKFLTQGFYCPDGMACKSPHLTNLNQLTDDNRTKLIDFVKKQPGLSWAAGKAPPGEA